MYVTATVRAGAIAERLTGSRCRGAARHRKRAVRLRPNWRNQFARRLVTLGESASGRTQITSGLKEGDRVVGDGSLFLQFRIRCSTDGSHGNQR